MCADSRRFGLITLLCLTGVSAQAQPSRILDRIDPDRRVILAKYVHPLAKPEFDRGPLPSAFPLPAIILNLKSSLSQQTSLRQLLAQQQDPTSDQYHKWLTPEQYADRFGVNSSDLDRITAWLREEGFKIVLVARGRTWIMFSGAAGLVDQAFHANLHRYQVRGEVHFANASNPSIPAALAAIVEGFHGLNDFHLKPRLIQSSTYPQAVNGNQHYLAPSDFATIYDIAPLYKAGIDGAGQTIAIVGQTSINLSDITSFRTKENLPAAKLTQVLVPGQTDPGISSGDLPEADLDIEWSGAIARNATVIYVYSNDVGVSLQYAVDQNVAPVISMSYGGCEESDLVDMPTIQTTALQANAQGMTWIAASGDQGAADCEDPDVSVAQDGLAVDAPGSVPEVTAMGGSEFMDSGGTYWVNGATINGGAATSYIPEKVWNDTSLNGFLAAAGGGTSIYFPRPGWQTGPGVPNDGARHLPDLSFNASADHDPYLVYTGGSGGYFGGTSAAAPTMAGVLALLNQYLVSSGFQSQPGLGNINPTLYRIAATYPSAFHNITTGNNIVPCVTGSPNCPNGTLGYSAGSNYSQASGLGSLDAYILFKQWSAQPPAASSVVASIDSNPVFEGSPDANGNSWTFTLTLTEEAGVGTTLTGFTMNGKSYDPAASFGSTAISRDGSISSKNLGLANLTVPANVVFTFSGMDATGGQWSNQISAPFSGPRIPLTVAGASNAASGQASYAPGMLLSVYGTALGDFAQSAGTIPLTDYLAGFEAWVNNVPAPLYFVSPNQVNIQIPYETQPGPATLTVGNPYINLNYPIQIAMAAPGIFASKGAAVPYASGSRGKTYTIYITGEGQVEPAVPTGRSPTGEAPKPVQPVTLKVGGVQAAISFIGIPKWAVGVTQINFQVPATAPLGVQPVVVTVGGVSSPSVTFTVTQ